VAIDSFPPTETDLTLPLAAHRALLFDLDGTLADSMPLSNQSWIEILGRSGCSISEAILHEYSGVPTRKTVEILNQRFGWTLDLDLVTAEKERLYAQIVAQVQPISAVVDIARRFHGRKAMAVVSGGIRETVNRTLQVIGVAELFHVRVCAEDCERGKPNPDPYLLAAQQLGVAPSECLVFEDGAAGIRSAQAAKMKVVQVSLQHTLRLLPEFDR